MELDAFNKLLLETVGVGLVIASYPDLNVIFRNERVLQWYPEFDEGGGAIGERFEGLDAAALRTAMDASETFRAQIETKVRRRTFSLAVVATRAVLGEDTLVVVELQNNSKVRELESMIASYSKMIEQQNRSLAKEKERAEKLLLNIMPESVYNELKTFGVTTPQRYDEASIMMLDFVNFTRMSVELDPLTVVTELNDIFTTFDRIAEQHGCERIKTIGDAYVAVAGLPEPAPDHAESIARFALMCVRFLKRRNETHQVQWNCRIGLAPGPVIGSVVGIQKYVYDIFGPGVNFAARLEALAEPMDILIGDDMYQRLHSEFRIEEVGEAEIRGFGPRRIYRLRESERSATRFDAPTAPGLP